MYVLGLIEVFELNYSGGKNVNREQLSITSADYRRGIREI